MRGVGPELLERATLALQRRFKRRFYGDSSPGVGDLGPTEAAIQRAIVHAFCVIRRIPEPGDSETRRFGNAAIRMSQIGDSAAMYAACLAIQPAILNSRDSETRRF